MPRARRESARRARDAPIHRDARGRGARDDANERDGETRAIGTERGRERTRRTDATRRDATRRDERTKR
jgi:hypothetical protein